MTEVKQSFDFNSFPFSSPIKKTENFISQIVKAYKLTENLAQLNNTNEFINLLKENNIFFDDKKTINEFFITNNINMDLLKQSIEIIRSSFGENTEIVVEYNPDYKRDLNIRVRKFSYEDNNKFLSYTIKIENIILDMLDDAEATFNITIDTDYKEPEHINSDKQSRTI